jgi:hypothetical protein
VKSIILFYTLFFFSFVHEKFRLINEQEIRQLKYQRCHSEDWSKIFVHPQFRPDRVWDTAFSGEIRLGLFESMFELPSGVKIQSGICHAKLHNVSVGDNTCFENIHKYLPNTKLGTNAYRERRQNIRRRHFLISARGPRYLFERDRRP